MRCFAVSLNLSIFSSTYEQRRRSLSLSLFLSLFSLVHSGVVSSLGNEATDARDVTVDDDDNDNAQLGCSPSDFWQLICTIS